MKKIKHYLYGAIYYLLALHAQAEVKLPSWAAGDANARRDEIGETIVDWTAGTLGIVIILGICYCGYLFSSGDGEKGQKVLRGVLIGGLLTGSTYGFAQFFV